jgi:hypothetical protein
MKHGRNDPCHCGSGKKYKKCCSAKDAAERSAELAAEVAAQTEAAADEPAPKGKGKPSNPTPSAGGVAPRPKGPPPRSPNQVRRRDV